MLLWAPYWLAVTLFAALLYLAVALLILRRRFQNWGAVPIALVVLVSLPVLPLTLLIYLIVELAVLGRGLQSWGRLAVALFLMACAGSDIVIGTHALGLPGSDLVFWALAPALFLPYFYLFSDARFVTRSTRWLALVYGLGEVGRLFASAGGGSGSGVSHASAHLPAALVTILTNVGLTVGDVVAGALVVVGVAAQVRARYRHQIAAGASTPAGPRVLIGAAAVGVALVAGSALVLAPPVAATALPLHLVRVALYLVATLLPIPVGYALLQVRPYDGAALANRVLLYGALTLCLALVYAASALIVFAVFGSGAGGPQLAIIASTLIIAALFRPLRTWLQRSIDRWLFPRKYQAGPIFAQLSAALPAETRLDQLTDRLVTDVQVAMQPDSVMLWLRTSPSLSMQAVERALLPQARARKPDQPARSEARAWVLEVRRRTDEEAAAQPTPPLVLAPDDPLRAALPQVARAIEVEHLPQDAASAQSLRAVGARLVLLLVDEGDLLGVLALGPRSGGPDYSFDDGEPLDALAAQVAPALRVALVVHEQDTQTLERQRVEQEMLTARRIQQTLLPKEIPTLEGWRIATYYEPAREVGGDFYDFLPFADGRLGLVIGDVTDKGVPAALVMATTRSMLRAAATESVTPGAVLARVNELLYADLPPNMFVTCFYAILDPHSGRLHYANAGQDLPYRRHAEGVCELRARGMPLGLMPGMAYEEVEDELAPGDSVLFYSDGLVEAHNPRREMFGMPRLAELLAGEPADGATIDALLAALAAFTGLGWEQEDDVTLVTVRRAAASETRPAREASPSGAQRAEPR